MGGNSKNSNPKFTRERQIFHYTFLFDAYDVTTYKLIKCGIEKKTIYNLQHNKNVTVITLEKLCTILDCSVENIVEIKPNKIETK